MGTLGIGQTIIILTAGIDLSVGAIMVFASIVMAKLQVEMGVPAPLAIGAGAIAGILCGGLNGVLITRLRLPPFISTLGTMSIFFALNIYVSHAATIRGVDMDPLLLVMDQTHRDPRHAHHLWLGGDAGHVRPDGLHPVDDEVGQARLRHR